MAATPPSVNPLDPANARRVTECLSAAIGREVSLAGPVEATSGGIENCNYYVAIRVGDGIERFVLRCQPGVVADWRQSMGGHKLRAEYDKLRALEPLGLGSPRAWGYDNGKVLGVPCFLMERLPGESMGWDYDPRWGPELVCLYAERIAAITRVPHASHPALAAVLEAWPMARMLDWLAGRAARFATDPLVPYALAWLRERMPAARPMVFCHSDPNPSNFLVQDGRISGVVDWEFACLKDDPLDELTCVGWLYQREDFKEIFCHALGRTVDDLTWFWAKSHFGNAFAGDSTTGPWPEAHRRALAKMVGCI